IHPFFFHDTAPTAIYPLSLHDALPISPQVSLGRREIKDVHPEHTQGRMRLGEGIIQGQCLRDGLRRPGEVLLSLGQGNRRGNPRSEEHTSELQSRENLVCRLLLEKKKK